MYLVIQQLDGDVPGLSHHMYLEYINKYNNNNNSFKNNINEVGKSKPPLFSLY